MDVGGGRGLVGLVEPSKLTTMRHFNMLTWPKNHKNPISKDLNFKNFYRGMSLAVHSVKSCSHLSVISWYIEDHMAINGS